MRDDCKRLQVVRGTKDLFGEELEKLNYIRRVCVDISSLYGYTEIQTPIMEFTELFLRGLGELSDIVAKEMYTFVDKSGDSITLRPEMTAPNVRAILANQMKLPTKLFSYGPVFRHERPQKGRYRQFHQLNMESFGNTGPNSDAESISLAWNILEALGLCTAVKLEINYLGSQEVMESYKASLKQYLTRYKSSLSSDSQRRLEANTLRILDSKAEQDQEIIHSAPKISDHYDAQSHKEFNTLLSKLSTLSINYLVNHKLVRGLDYYSGTVFEFTTEMLGAQGAVMAGGRYDRLAKEMGGIEIPSIGFAAGAERISKLINIKSNVKRPLVLIAMVENEIVDLTLYKLRKLGIYAELIFCEPNKLNKALKTAANHYGAAVCTILGASEIQSGISKIRNMDTGNELDIEINLNEASVSKIKKVLSEITSNATTVDARNTKDTKTKSDTSLS